MIRQTSLVHPFPLPQGKIHILNRQWRQLGRLSRYKCFVQGDNLGNQNTGGPTIGDNVVHGNEKDKFIIPQLQQPVTN